MKDKNISILISRQTPFQKEAKPPLRPAQAIAEINRMRAKSALQS